MVEKTYSYRTTDEDFIKYINDKWNGSFSGFINGVKDKELKIIKQNKVKNFLTNSINSLFMIGLGAILMTFSMYTYNLMVLIGTLFLGGFLLIYGLLLIYLEVVSVWKAS